MKFLEFHNLLQQYPVQFWALFLLALSLYMLKTYGPLHSLHFCLGCSHQSQVPISLRYGVVFETGQQVKENAPGTPQFGRLVWPRSLIAVHL